MSGVVWCNISFEFVLYQEFEHSSSYQSLRLEWNLMHAHNIRVHLNNTKSYHIHSVQGPLVLALLWLYILKCGQDDSISSLFLRKPEYLYILFHLCKVPVLIPCYTSPLYQYKNMNAHITLDSHWLQWMENPWKYFSNRMPCIIIKIPITSRPFSHEYIN